MPTSLDKLIAKNEEKLVDQAATTLKVMFGVAYADVAQEELEERLYRLFDALIEITKQSSPDPSLVANVVDSVMVTPVYSGWNHRAITEEVLQVIDMVINHQIDKDLTKPEQDQDRQDSKALLALTIRAAKDIVNGRSRRDMAERTRKRERWTGSGGNLAPAAPVVPETDTPEPS